MTTSFLCGREPVSLIILAGGESRRMKRNKALLPLKGITLIEYILCQIEGRFDEVLISVSDLEKLRFLSYPLVLDEKPLQGPMMGIMSALEISRNEKNFIMACDIPDINLAFMKQLISRAKGWDAVIPIQPHGRREPLFAVYSKHILPQMKKLIDTDNLSLLPLLDQCRVKYVEIEDPSWLVNLNTEEDYRKFLKEFKE
jgi:molybdopterin-guanine dinucleotide biosynthesis protein A